MSARDLFIRISICILSSVVKCIYLNYQTYSWIQSFGLPTLALALPSAKGNFYQGSLSYELDPFFCSVLKIFDINYPTHIMEAGTEFSKLLK